MKIQVALQQNKSFWEEEKAKIERQLGNHQAEVQRLAKLHNEATEQIALYEKAAELLATLDQDQINKVNVVK